MSDDGGGTDNPAFSNDEEASYDNSASTASVGQQEAVRPSSEHEHPPCDSKSAVENGKSIGNGNIAEQQRPGETRIELPENIANDNKCETPKTKQNGVHGNGNNNDVSFLNTTVTSVTNNDVIDKKEQIEAVNLELVSMKPYAGANNGQTKNQEACEVPTDPYEEYFVPVNEHRKYIRGEKLYVTKDKRSTGSYWRRVLCWGCGFLLVAIAAIIAILAGTGVILTQEATQPLLNADKTSYRQFNEVQTAGSQEYIKQPPSSPSPATSTFPPWQTTDETLYKLVPKALVGVIKLDNLDWNDDMFNPKSRVYRDVAEHIEISLVNMLSLNDNKPIIRVYSISKDGEVNFRVSHPALEKPEDNQYYLENKFHQNANSVGKYHISHLKMNVLVDECSSGIMDCSHYCTYDYMKGLFLCSCPSDKILDINGKQCKDITHLDRNHQRTGTLLDDVQGRSRIPDDVFHADDHIWNTNFDLDPKHDENPLEHKSQPTSVIEPKTESSLEPNLETKMEADPKVEPSAEVESKFEPEQSAEPESKSEPKSSTKSDPTSEPKTSVEPEPNSEPEPSVEPESNSELEPSAEPEPNSELEPSAEPEPKSELEPSAEPEPNSEPKPLAEAKSKSEPDQSAEPEPNSEPSPSVEPEPNSESEPSAEPEFRFKLEQTAESQPKSVPEPLAESEPTFESEPSAEPSADPEPKFKYQSSVMPEVKSQPEPSTEPKPSFTPESEPKAESEPQPKSEPEPLAEPEPNSESMSEHKSAPEPSAEPEPNFKSSTYPELKSDLETKVEPEPTSEPETSIHMYATSLSEPVGEPESLDESAPGSEPEPSAESEDNFETDLPVHQEPKFDSKPLIDAEPKSELEPSSIELITKSKSESLFKTELSVKPELLDDSELSTALELTTEAGVLARSKPWAEPVLTTKAAPSIEFKNETEPYDDLENKSQTIESTIVAPTADPENKHPTIIFNSNEESVLKPDNIHKSETETKSISDLVPSTRLKMESEQSSEMKNDQKSVAESDAESQPTAEPKSDTETATDLENETDSLVESKNKEEESTTLFESSTDAVTESERTTNIASKVIHSDIIHKSPNVVDVFLKPKNESKKVTESKIDSKSVTEFNVGPESTTESKFLLTMSATEININAEQKDYEIITETTMTTNIPDTNKATSEKNLSDIPEDTKQLSTETPISLSSLFSKADAESITEQNDELKMKLDKNLESSKELIFSTEVPKGLINETQHQVGIHTKIKSEDEFSTTQMIEPVTVVGLNNDDSNVYSSSENPLESSQNKIENNAPNNDSVKKAPRLDKDEQYIPNPFELSVKDVIATESTTTLPVTHDISLSTYPEKYLDTSFNISEINNASQHNIEPISHEAHEVVGVNKKQEEISEDQYNDILDEFDPKGYGKNDLGKNEKKILKISKDSKNTDYTSINKSSETQTQSSVDRSIEKQSEDPNITSQVPILPVEIQMDMITTENVEKMEAQATSQEPDKEAIVTINSSNVPHGEVKTTEQIPFLPEELQTTEDSKEQHTESSTIIYQINKRVDESSTYVDDDIYKNETILKTNEMIKMNESNSSIMESSSMNKTYSKMNESSKEVDVKPVFESISDDTVPQTFEYKYFLTTTTENSESRNIFDELSEERLKVIPLENKSDLISILKSDNQQTKFKKEKELSLEISNRNIEPTAKNITKSSRTVEDENIPKLISGTITDESKMNSTFSSMKNGGDLNAQNFKYPNFIPVSEEIDENDNRFTEPSITTISSKNEEKNIESERKTTILPTNKFIELSTLNSVNNANENDNITASKLEDKENETSSTSSARETLKAEDQVIPVAILNSEDPLLPSFFSKCKSGQFQCLNGTSRDGAYCVNLSAKCDSENDCSDGSDEVNCEKEGCPGNFQCASGQCLKRHLVCNGIVDCDDGSDEKECGQWKCNFDEFQCPNGRCIPVLWQCDGRPDCENHADEYSCSESCDNDEYLCPVEKWCIPQTWRCNGVSECLNEEDEKLCECAIEQFKCETGGCIPVEQLCDGVENCPDKSDEWDCLSNLSKNTSTSTDFDKENKDNVFSCRSTPLKIRQSSGDFRFVCSDGWSEEFSDQYCRTLGFAASESTQYIEQGANKNLLQLISNASPNASLVINLEKVNSCKSDKVVEISCQEFICGSHESVRPTARLVGGTPASEGQWSSVALLREPKSGSACTASVLSPMHALASFSCIHSYKQSSGWQLFVGGNLLKPHKVKNIVPYPQVKYNQFLYNNDIALVELDEPLIFSRNVSAVCLPNQSFQPRQLCVTAGWGFPVNGEVDLQQYLKFLPVPTYDSEECNATSHYAGFITKHNICAGFTDTDKGPCYNDEGAPLMCVSETGRWEIQGLLSHHSRCSRGHPAIYSSIAPALSWLRNSVPALKS